MAFLLNLRYRASTFFLAQGVFQKLQTGLDAGVIIETPDADGPAHFFPAVMCDQFGKNRFKSYTVQRIRCPLVSHAERSSTCSWRIVSFIVSLLNMIYAVFAI